MGKIRFTFIWRGQDDGKSYNRSITLPVGEKYPSLEDWEQMLKRQAEDFTFDCNVKPSVLYYRIESGAMKKIYTQRDRDQVVSILRDICKLWERT